MGDGSQWGTLAVAAVGVAGTWGAGAWAQRQASRREDLRWVRERERERETWGREDRQHVLDLRRAAYVDFMTHWHEVFDAAFAATKLGESLNDQGGWLDSLYMKLETVRLYGSEVAAKLGSDAFDALARVDIKPHDVQLPLDMINKFHAQVRKDLGVPSD